MKSATVRAVIGSALLSLAAEPVIASTAHRHLHQHYKNNHTHGGDDLELVKPRARLTNRSGQCAFPEEAGLVAITPGSTNAGWAMSPDQECTAGSYCPFACPSGQVMNQWKPGTTYVYPESMDGGMYCDESGEITKPYPDREYCADGVGNVAAVNQCGSVVSFCQTVLPGNEAMLIPTSVQDTAVIAVPGTSYWDSTAAHYYVNAPGYDTDEACIWGTGSSAIGNWAPYVAGANQDSTGDTYVKIGWNPIYTDAFSGTLPTFGVKILCPDGECNGLPCSINPSTDGFGGVDSDESASGAGGADFCVVTVTSGSAQIVVFNVDGSDDDTSSSSSAKAASTSAALVKGLQAEKTTSTSSATPTPSSTSSSTSTSSTLKTSTSTPSSTSHSSSRSSSVSHTSTKSHTTARPSTTLAKSSGPNGGVFQEVGTATQSSESSTITSAASIADATAAASASASSTSDAGSTTNQGSAAFAGLVVAFVAAACLY